MDRHMYASDQRRTVLEVLADLTRYLSSTSNWRDGLSQAVEAVAELLPRSLVAAGVLHEGEWIAFHAPKCISPDIADELHSH